MPLQMLYCLTGKNQEGGQAMSREKIYALLRQRAGFFIPQSDVLRKEKRESP